MKINLPTTGALALGLAMEFTRASVAAPKPEAPIKLAGVWKLNKELSEDPGTKMMEAMRDRGGPGGGRGMGAPGGGGMGGAQGGGGGMGGGDGMGGSGMGPGGRRPGGGGSGKGGMMGGEPPLDGTPDGERPQGPPPDRGARAGEDDDQNARRPRRGMGGMGMGPIPSTRFTIEQDGENLAFRTENNLRLLHSDGEKRKKEGDAGRLEVVTRFLKGSLLIESRPETGGKRKETYTLRPDGKLEIDFDFEGSGPMPGLKFKLVYDAAHTGEV